MRAGPGRAISMCRPMSAACPSLYPSPDGKRMLLVEMNEGGTLDRGRLAPMDGSSTGQQIGRRAVPAPLPHGRPMESG